MAWIYLVVAGLFEVLWAYTMKLSQGFSRLIPSVITVVGMLVSFGLLTLAMRTLPLGTAYVIWTGIGAVGTFLLGIIFLSESLSLTRVIAAVFIIVGLVLMKLSSPK